MKNAVATNKIILCILLILTLSGCQVCNRPFEPEVVYTPSSLWVESNPSAFSLIKPEELRMDWGKELRIGNAFVHEYDLYRAITSYKRALFILPQKYIDRQMEIEYKILLCYYLGNKYRDAVQTFECGKLSEASPDFPAYRDLLILLYDSYRRIEETAKACRIWALLEIIDPEAAQKMQLTDAVIEVDFASLHCMNTGENRELSSFLLSYESSALSVTKAKTLNALLPGAGYLYVGQVQTAWTAFLLNGLFIAASYEFFRRDYIAAGLITAGFEMGWYLGGINGAGIAATEYNERIYEFAAKEFLGKQRLFPLLMLHYSF